MKPAVSRVAVICDYSLGYLGGAQTAMLQEAAALVAAGAQVTIISPTADQVWQRVKPAQRVDHLQIPARFTVPSLDLPVVINSRRLRRRLEMIFDERGIQVVHLQSEFGLAAAALQTAEQHRIPVVHTVHTFFWQGPRRGQVVVAAGVRTFHRWVTGLRPTRQRLADRPADQALRNMTLTIARRVDLVISPSAHQAERLSTAGVERVETVPNTVAALPQAQVLDRIDGPLKIIWIGRCVPEKRILTFVGAAVRTLQRAAPGMIEFTVAGDGSQLEQARGMAADSPQIRFVGRQDHDRIPELLTRSHLLALTSRGFDNQPMTIVEAVMALRGVVYCDTALSEGLAGPGISSPASEEALSDTFVDLVRHPERVIDASRAAESARRQFSPQHHAASLLTHYAALTERVRRGP